MKRVLSLFLLLFFTFSTVGFTEEDEFTKKEKTELKKCLRLNDNTIKESQKDNIFANLFIMMKLASELVYMEEHPQFQKEHMKCYQLMKRAKEMLRKKMDDSSDDTDNDNS